MATKFDEYRAGLSLLSLFGSLPLELADVVAPHLSAEDIADIVARSEKETVYFAAPSVRVRGAFQILTAKPARVADEKRGLPARPACLSYAYAGRTVESYEDGNLKGDVIHPYLHSDKAVAYAVEHWADKLVLDSWGSLITIVLQDPTDLIGSDRKPSPISYADGGWHGIKAYPKTKLHLHITIDRDWNDLINERLKPESVAINDALVEVTADDFVFNEIRGGRGGFTNFNCAHCGGGLGLTSCTGCGHRFDDDQYRCGGSTPLSQKMFAYLAEIGFTFRGDVKSAVDSELASWKKYSGGREQRDSETVAQTEAPVSTPVRERVCDRFAEVDGWDVRMEKLTQGSAAAAELLQKLGEAKLMVETRHQGFNVGDAMTELDRAGIYGDEIVALHQHGCGGDDDIFITLLFAHNMRQVTATTLHAMLEGRGYDIGAESIVNSLKAYFGNKRDTNEESMARRVLGLHMR